MGQSLHTLPMDSKHFAFVGVEVPLAELSHSSAYTTDILLFVFTQEALEFLAGESDPRHLHAGQTPCP